MMCMYNNVTYIFIVYVLKHSSLCGGTTLKALGNFFPTCKNYTQKCSCLYFLMIREVQQDPILFYFWNGVKIKFIIYRYRPRTVAKRAKRSLNSGKKTFSTQPENFLFLLNKFRCFDYSRGRQLVTLV